MLSSGIVLTIDLIVRAYYIILARFFPDRKYKKFHEIPEIICMGYPEIICIDILLYSN